MKLPPPIYMFIFAGMMLLLNKILPLSVWLDSPWNQLGLGIIALSFIPATGAFRLFKKVKTTFNPFQPEKSK